MPFCPLWSAVVGHPREPISNAPAENHFRQVKSNLKPGVKKMYAEFIGSRYASIQNLLPRLVFLILKNSELI